MIIYIYALADENKSYRYIGSTNDTTKRLAQHMKEEGESLRAIWIQSLIKQNKEPNLITLAQTEDENEVEMLKQIAIDKYRYYGLFNPNLNLEKKQAFDKSFTVRISDSFLKRIKRAAQLKKINYQGLIRLWLEEKLQEIGL